MPSDSIGRRRPTRDPRRPQIRRAFAVIRSGALLNIPVEHRTYANVRTNDDGTITTEEFDRREFEDLRVFTPPGWGLWVEPGAPGSRDRVERRFGGHAFAIGTAVPTGRTYYAIDEVGMLRARILGIGRETYTTSDDEPPF